MALLGTLVKGSHFGAHPVELIGDVGQVEACFSQFEESVSLDAR